MDIPVDRLTIRYSRASGPGGQHVNKVSTRVEVRFVLADADWIPTPARLRIQARLANQLTRDGELIVTSDRYRQQSRNLADCIAKLSALLDAAAYRPPTRRPTRPSRAAKARRLDSKRRLSTKKRNRSWRPDD